VSLVYYLFIELDLLLAPPPYTVQKVTTVEIFVKVTATFHTACKLSARLIGKNGGTAYLVWAL